MAVTTVALFFTGLMSVVLASADVNSNANRITILERRLAGLSKYCSLHANGQCGPCICRDDFKLEKKYYCDCQNITPRRDCREHYEKGLRTSGVYVITMNGYRNTQAFCDHSHNGGGWTVIQRRFDGSENFYRNWQQYKDGFGKLQREFWFGNQNIHALTAQAILPQGSQAMVYYRLASSGRIGDRYDQFQVDNERLKYRLHATAKGVASSTNSLSGLHNNMQFSTYDRDSDNNSSKHCARLNHGGWWYNNCNAAYNMNGDYDRYQEKSGQKTFNWSGHQLVASEIQVRRK